MAEIGLNKIFLFPKKFNKLLEVNKNNFDFSYPISVELSLTNKCNFNCIWCSDYHLRDRLGGEFKKEVLFKLFEELDRGGTKGICVEGGGEPTLYPNFRETIQKINKLGMAIGLITNGSILNYADMIDLFEWIRISLDVSNAKQMKKLKGVICFNKIIENIKKILSKRKKTVVGIGYVLSTLNMDGLENIIKKTKAMGVDYFHIRPVIDSPKIMLPLNTDLNYLKKFESDKFKVLIDAINENKIRGNAGLPCVAHSATATITADGSVYICGRLNIYDWWKELGNLNKNSFKKIWLGSERIKQTKQLLNRNFCQKYCPECRITKFNILINDLKKTKTKNFI